MATIYISPTGSDTTGNGTEGNPYKTVGKSVSVASNGDVISCVEGTYDWDTLDFNVSVTIRPVPGSSVVFDADSEKRIWSVAGVELDVEDIEFVGLGNPLANNGPVFKGYGISSVSQISFTRCVFHDIECAGVADGRDAFFSNQGVWEGSSYSAFTFVACKFYDVRGGTSRASPLLFGVTNAESSITVDGCIVYLSGSSPCTYLFGLGINDPSLISVNNSIFQNGSEQTVSVHHEYSFAPDINYSCLNQIDSVPSGDGNITDDPLFISPDTADFFLSQNSPCRGTGHTL